MTLIHEYVTRQAERRPDATALVMEDERLTYGELEEESNRLARLLVESGCRRGDRVCIFQPKRPIAIVSMLAALKADCAYVPIDVASPAPRVAKIVEAAEPRVVLVDAASSALLDATRGRDLAACGRGLRRRRASRGRALHVHVLERGLGFLRRLARPDGERARRTRLTCSSPPGRPGRPRAS